MLTAGTFEWVERDVLKVTGYDDAVPAVPVEPRRSARKAAAADADSSSDECTWGSRRNKRRRRAPAAAAAAAAAPARRTRASGVSRAGPAAPPVFALPIGDVEASEESEDDLAVAFDDKHADFERCVEGKLEALLADVMDDDGGESELKELPAAPAVSEFMPGVDVSEDSEDSEPSTSGSDSALESAPVVVGVDVSRPCIEKRLLESEPSVFNIRNIKYDPDATVHELRGGVRHRLLGTNKAVGISNVKVECKLHPHCSCIAYGPGFWLELQAEIDHFFAVGCCLTQAADKAAEAAAIHRVCAERIPKRVRAWRAAARAKAKAAVAKA